MDRRVSFTNTFCFVLSGISIGLLVGMSESPVIGNLINSIVVLLLSIVSVFSGLKNVSDEGKRIPKINPIPITVFVVSLTIGTLPGIYIRTHNLFSPKHPFEVSEKNKYQQSVLFEFSTEQCDIACRYSGKELLDFLETNSDEEWLSNILKESLGDECLAERLILKKCEGCK